jgi:hypothetical protein
MVVVSLIDEHYGLDKATSPQFVYDDQGDDIGIVFLLNGRLQFLPRGSDEPRELSEDILPKRMPKDKSNHGEDGDQGDRVKIVKIVTDRTGPRVGVEWELPFEKGQILLLELRPDAAASGVGPAFVEVFNTGRNQQSGQVVPEAGQSKHFIGGFDQNSRLYFYKLDAWENDESWGVKRFDPHAPPLVEDLCEAGYYPEHLGILGDRAVWSNRHGRWRCGLNGALPQDPYHRYREAGWTEQGLLAIRDESYGHESVLGQVAFSDGEVEFTPNCVLSHDAQFVRNPPNPIPSGVVTHVSVSPVNHLFVVFNDDHGARLTHQDAQGDVQSIDIAALEAECGGSVSIFSIDSSNDRLAIEVSNFHRSHQIWIADVNKNGVGPFAPLFHGLTHQVDSFSIDCLVHSSPAHTIDGASIEFNWFELSSTDVKANDRTVVYIHGGPAVRLKLEHKPDIAALIQEGYRVIAPNVPGSAGQGGWFAGLDDGVDARLALFETAWVPFLKELHHKYGPLCLYGGSYAGWVIAKILTTPAQGFVGAAFVRNGVTDWDVFVQSTAPFRKRNRCTEYFGEPDPNPDALPGMCEDLNPTGVSNIEPSMVKFVVGLSDTRVPPECTTAFVNQAWPNAGPGQRNQMIERIRGQGHQIRGKEVQMGVLRMAIDLFETVA